MLRGTTQRPWALIQIRNSDSAQNLENKRPAIFRPPRSMVLKVVRGIILETLELRRLSAWVPFWDCGQRCAGPIWRGGSPKRDGSTVRLSKIEYYLVDNIYTLTLSPVMDRVQEESGKRFPNWNQGGACAVVQCDRGASQTRGYRVAKNASGEEGAVRINQRGEAKMRTAKPAA